MKKHLKFLCLAFLCLSCDDEPLPPCQLSQTGWVCKDTGTDLSNDVLDMSGDQTQTDQGASPDLSMDTGSEDVRPEVDMDVVEMLPPKNCEEINTRNLPTGNHDIEIGGQMKRVHCNNDVDGGGWMLIARSVSGGTGPFGWTQESGDVENDNVVFSLGSTTIPFTQVLATNYTNGKAPGDRQYIVTLPNNFLIDCSAASCQTTVSSPTNTCADNINGNDIFMFDYVGWISTNDFFWFREIVEDAGTGFHPDGWRLFFDNCRAGEIHTQQGLLFVR